MVFDKSIMVTHSYAVPKYETSSEDLSSYMAVILTFYLTM